MTMQDNLTTITLNNTKGTVVMSLSFNPGELRFKSILLYLMLNWAEDEEINILSTEIT